MAPQSSMTMKQVLKCAHCFPQRLEDIDGRLAVTDEDSHALGVRYVKFWVDDAPSSPTEGRSPVGEEAPSRASPHHVGISPFPNLSSGDVSRAPTSPERRDRPSRDQMGSG